MNDPFQIQIPISFPHFFEKKSNSVFHFTRENETEKTDSTRQPFSNSCCLKKKYTRRKERESGLTGTINALYSAWSSFSSIF